MAELQTYALEVAIMPPGRVSDIHLLVVWPIFKQNKAFPKHAATSVSEALR